MVVSGDSRNCQHGDSDLLQHGVSDSAKCDNSSELQQLEMCCPVCSKPIENSADSMTAVNAHIDECLNMQSLENLEDLSTFDSNPSCKTSHDRKRKTCSSGNLGKSSHTKSTKLQNSIKRYFTTNE